MKSFSHQLTELNDGSMLDRPERAIEDAFAGYVATVRERSGYRVLIGMAG